MTLRPIRRALLSVHDKTGLAELATALHAHKVELVSTGGTARTLRDAGLPVTEVSEVTGAPEMLGGRVKTLHPAIHGGILARRDDPADLATLEQHLIPTIDLVVVNLYPFEATLARGAGLEECIEEIDIGGVALIRAAAKNHTAVAVLTEPADYSTLIQRLDQEGGSDEPLRRRLAAKAFARTATYDAAIAAWLTGETGDRFPDRLTLPGTLRQRLRYGENPHQAAAFYTSGPPQGLGAATLVQGRELSYNNLADADAALALVAEFTDPAIAIIKHANPCGVGTGTNAAEAHACALACDPTSAYGGIVACNRPLDAAAAEAITALFTEVVIAPDADEAARAAFARKSNLRLLVLDPMLDPGAGGLELRTVRGGFLAQERDTAILDERDLRCVTAREPSKAELRDLLFAWTVVKHVRSNAIVLARDGATVGIGAGQMSRVDAVELAVRKARANAGPARSVLASDAFFPFPDGLEAAIAAGITAAIQPGGSLRDEQVIAAADAAGIAMLFTGQRHFRH
jgi:phosphoribosylaminoimidazolecarboxamide formyltransferase/IMP cyclohydrolase